MKKRDCTICVAKTKALISFAVTAKLIYAFVFAYAEFRFSHDAAQICVFRFTFLFCKPPTYHYTGYQETTKTTGNNQPDREQPKQIKSMLDWYSYTCQRTTFHGSFGSVDSCYQTGIYYRLLHADFLHGSCSQL